MRRKIHLLSFASLTFAMSVCLLYPASSGQVVQAADTSIYDFDTDYWALHGYTGTETNLVVPDQIQGCDVSVLYDHVFNDSAELESLTLPNTLEELQESDVSWLPNLTSVTLPDSLLVIGQNCFANLDRLEEITIPANVCALEKDSVTFNYEMKKVTFTGVCPVIGAGALNYLHDDAVIYVPDDQYDAYAAALEKAGCEYPIETTGENAPAQEPRYDDANLVVENGIITQYNGFNVRLDIPEQLNGQTVTGIGPNAFESNWYLSYVNLPDTIETIDTAAFKTVNTLRYVHFPANLKTIADDAFNTAYHGSWLELPEGLETIGAHAFENAWLCGNLDIPEGVTTIGDSAFRLGTWLEEVYLPSTLTSVAANAFADETISYVVMNSVALPDMDPSVFTNCTSLADIDLNQKTTKSDARKLQADVDALGLSCYVWRMQNADVDYIRDDLDEYEVNPDGSDTVLLKAYSGEQAAVRPWDQYTIDGTNRDTVGIADGAFKGNQNVTYFAACYNDKFTYVGAEAFADSALETVDLFDSVETIGEGAFRNCAKLTELVLPESVTSIGAGAFEGCTGLENVTILCDLGALPEGAFAGCSSLKNVTFSAGNAIPASCFTDTALEAIDLSQITEIGANAFEHVPLASVDLSAVKTIGDAAFASNTALTKVDLTGVESVGAGAFAWDTALAEVVTADSVKAIGSGAWEGTAVTSFVIPAGLAADASAVPAIATGAIKISDAATEEEVAAWSEALEFPWYDKLTRVSEESAFKKMPFEATDESQFKVDENGVLVEYTGQGGVVVIPRSVGGLEVKAVGYHAFDACRDYTDTAMDSNQTDWVKVTGVVVPETVTMFEDSSFAYMQQLEWLVCYGPLDTTGKSTFMLDRGLTDVVFVNPIRVIDSYSFDECAGLKNFWYNGTLESIEANAFERCEALERFVVDAKNVGNGVFSHCTSMKELHVRSSVEMMITSVLVDCPAVETICLEVRSADVLNTENGSGGTLDHDVTLILPADLDDDAAHAIYNQYGPGNFGPITDESFVKREACALTEWPMPDVEKMAG